MNDRTRGCRTEMTHRAEQLQLPPADESVAGEYLEALRSEASAGSWRIVELSSLEGRPFSAELSWAAGAGPPRRPVRIEIPGDGRVSVFARFLSVRLVNRSIDGSNRVRVSVLDGACPTRNVAIAAGEGPGSAQVPPFASTVALETGRAADLPSCSLTLIDGGLVERAQYPGDRQPQGGTRLGDAARIDVDAPAGSPWRLVFGLEV